jgi:O-methyltransferase
MVSVAVSGGRVGKNRHWSSEFFPSKWPSCLTRQFGGLLDCRDAFPIMRRLFQSGVRRSADSAFDLVFLDSERPEYPGWWPNLRRVLRLGGLLVVDNATSHPEQMAPFMALVNADAEFSTSLVPIGNGEFLAVRSLK